MPRSSCAMCASHRSTRARRASRGNDLVGRKLARDRGAAMAALIQDLLDQLETARTLLPATRTARNAAMEALVALRDVTEQLVRTQPEAPASALAVAVPYLKLCGVTIAGALMARAAAVAEAALGAHPVDAPFYEAKLQTCRFYAEQVLPEAAGLARIVKSGAASVTEARPDLV